MKSVFRSDENSKCKFRIGKLYIRGIDNLIVLCTKDGNKIEGVIVHFHDGIGKHQTNFSGDFSPFVGNVILTED